MYCLLVICDAAAEILPLKFPARLPYMDMVTSLFCVILLLFTLLMAFNRRKFESVMRSLFSARIRTQMQRESKVFGEWFYMFAILFYFLVQAMLLFLLAQYVFPESVAGIRPFPLYFLLLGVVMADFFIKLLLTLLMSYIFECPEDRLNFNLTKFFVHTVNSVAVFPLLAATVYMDFPYLLFLYIPVFLTTFIVMIFRTLTLNSDKIPPFLFFLYFCTFEILPYLIVAKLLFTI